MSDSKQVKTSYYFRDENHRKAVQSWLVQNGLKFQHFVERSLDAALSGSLPANAQSVPSDTLSGYGLTAEERRVVETVIAILRDSRPEVRNSAGLIKSRVQEFRTYFSQEATAREKAAHVDEAQLQPSRSRKVG